MTLSRGCMLLLVAMLAASVMAETSTKDESSKAKSPVASFRTGVRTMRAAKASPVAQQRTTIPVQQTSFPSRTTAQVTSAPATTRTTPERQFEQQVLVVKGNPSEEKLNEEIRKAIRALLGPGQGDDVQIRELKNEEELRRVAPGARPIGVRLVQ